MVLFLLVLAAPGLWGSLGVNPALLRWQQQATNLLVQKPEVQILDAQWRAWLARLKAIPWPNANQQAFISQAMATLLDELLELQEKSENITGKELAGFGLLLDGLTELTGLPTVANERVPAQGRRIDEYAPTALKQLEGLKFITPYLSSSLAGAIENEKLAWQKIAAQAPQRVPEKVVAPEPQPEQVVASPVIPEPHRVPESVIVDQALGEWAAKLKRLEWSDNDFTEHIKQLMRDLNDLKKTYGEERITLQKLPYDRVLKIISAVSLLWKGAAKNAVPSSKYMDIVLDGEPLFSASVWRAIQKQKALETPSSIAPVVPEPKSVEPVPAAPVHKLVVEPVVHEQPASQAAIERYKARGIYEDQLPEALRNKKQELIDGTLDTIWRRLGQLDEDASLAEKSGINEYRRLLNDIEKFYELAISYIQRIQSTLPNSDTLRLLRIPHEHFVVPLVEYSAVAYGFESSILAAKIFDWNKALSLGAYRQDIEREQINNRLDDGGQLQRTFSERLFYLAKKPFYRHKANFWDNTIEDLEDHLKDKRRDLYQYYVQHYVVKQ